MRFSSGSSHVRAWVGIAEPILTGCLSWRFLRSDNGSFFLSFFLLARTRGSSLRVVYSRTRIGAGALCARFLLILRIFDRPRIVGFSRGSVLADSVSVAVADVPEGNGYAEFSIFSAVSRSASAMFCRFCISAFPPSSCSDRLFGFGSLGQCGGMSRRFLCWR
jgi:hypothetical protein